MTRSIIIVEPLLTFYEQRISFYAKMYTVHIKWHAFYSPTPHKKL